MNNNYKIYMHKNKINGKVYIGQTMQSLKQRWNNGHGYIKCPYFYKAIQKYGWDNFEHILLEDNLTKDEADEKEISYIDKYKSHKSEYGYNISLGGAGSLKENIPVYQYDLDGNYIRTWSSISEICDVLSVSSSHIYSCCNEKMDYIYDSQWKYYYQEKIDKVSTKGEKISSKKKKPIYQYSLDGEYIKKYDSATDAEIDGFGSSNIRACCNGRMMSSYGYQWRDYYKPRINPIADRYTRQSENSVKKVYQYTINGTYIKEYKSLTEASEATSLNFKNISACCNGKTKTCGGFRWSYIFKEKLPILEENKKVKKGVWGKKVQQILDDVIVAEYVSANEAFRQTGINGGSICRCCKGDLKTAGGYIWKYAS